MKHYYFAAASATPESTWLRLLPFIPNLELFALTPTKQTLYYSLLDNQYQYVIFILSVAEEKGVTALPSQSVCSIPVKPQSFRPIPTLSGRAASFPKVSRPEFRRVASPPSERHIPQPGFRPNRFPLFPHPANSKLKTFHCYPERHAPVAPSLLFSSGYFSLAIPPGASSSSTSSISVLSFCPSLAKGRPPVSYLESMLTKVPATILSKELPQTLNPLEATFTKNRGGYTAKMRRIISLPRVFLRPIPWPAHPIFIV